MSDRPYLRYVCSTILSPQPVVVSGDDFDSLGVELVPAGGIVCDAETDDNRDTGYPASSYASWRTTLPDRFAFDRLIGKSRRGVTMDVTVELDGQTI